VIISVILSVCPAASDTGPVDLSSLDFLKESFQMAGNYNWNNVDLTQFPGEFFSYAPWSVAFIPTRQSNFFAVICGQASGDDFSTGGSRSKIKFYHVT